MQRQQTIFTKIFVSIIFVYFAFQFTTTFTTIVNIVNIFTYLLRITCAFYPRYHRIIHTAFSSPFKNTHFTYRLPPNLVARHRPNDCQKSSQPYQSVSVAVVTQVLYIGAIRRVFLRLPKHSFFSRSMLYWRVLTDSNRYLREEVVTDVLPLNQVHTDDCLDLSPFSGNSVGLVQGSWLYHTNPVYLGDIGAPSWNRTNVKRLQGSYSTIELCAQRMMALT